MSDTKFTRAPWLWEAGRHTCLVRSRAGDLLAVVHCNPTAEGRNANTRLICAAPDLYAALESLVRAVCDDHSLPPRHTLDVMSAASHALAKARGEA